MNETVDRLVAHEEIRQLAARSPAMDSRDLDTFVSLFVDDVRVGRDARGREALHGFFEESLRDIGTHVIDVVDSDHTSGSVYCEGEIQVGDKWIHQAILYRDTYERRNGRWYFVRRIHELWYGAEVGASPVGLPPANSPERHEGSGTLPGASPRGRRSGGRASAARRRATAPRWPRIPDADPVTTTVRTRVRALSPTGGK